MVMAFLAAPILGSAQVYTWTKTSMNGSRTGVGVPAADGFEKTLGRVCGKTYYAPNGKVYKGGTIGKVAKAVLAAQPTMAEVKKVVGYSPVAMTRKGPDATLPGWAVKVIMERTAQEAGKRVDVGILNYGGIRVDMPQGNILVDDILSMFPFKNSLEYVSVKGSRLREILDGMAAGKMQVLGGVKLVVKDGRAESILIDGKPLDDEATYGLATISFLLNGGDNLFLGEGAEEVVDIPIDIYDVVMDYIVAQTAAGKNISAEPDRFVTYL